MGSIIMTDYLIRCIFAIICVIYNLCNSRSSVTLYLVDIALAAVVFQVFSFPTHSPMGERGLCIQFDCIYWIVKFTSLLCHKRTLVLRYFQARGTWGEFSL